MAAARHADGAVPGGTDAGNWPTGGRLVIADLGGLEFIDSSGLAALRRARRDARRAGGDLLLAVPQGPVLRILAITRLIDEFSVHASLHEAAASTRTPEAAVGGGDITPERLG